MPLRRSKISWCDYSSQDLNFVIGCTPVSEGCANCYAATWAKRCGRDFSDVTTYWDKLNRLWKAKWEPGDTPYRRGPGSKPIMFPVDLGDLFHPQVDEDFILWALDLMADRDDADWVVLTKRAERMLQVTNDWLCLTELQRLPDNIWCLITAENQRRADERIPILLQVKAQVFGVSIEPILEPVQFHSMGTDKECWDALNGTLWIPGEVRDIAKLNWVILGAESGPNRRPFDEDWARQVRDDCHIARVPFFFKQSSGLYPGNGPCLDGEIIQEFPA